MSKETVDSAEVSLFVKRKKLYPREVHGLFASLRVTGVVVLLSIFYFLPWFNFNEHQIVLFDLPARKFYIFHWIFWPQDFIYLALLLICGALALFLFTALAGRLWCGYACPQTVWTEIFLWIERKVEGSWTQQIKLDKQESNARKTQIKVTKHAIWIILSLITGFTFVGFFIPIRELFSQIINFQLSPWETFWLLFYSLATYGNAGWLREQVCMYMCPYARFQSAMLDKDSLLISYDALRGEARGGRKRGDDVQAKQLGDCIDCNMCVQVCPVGIDIRDGMQYECIGCAACIDVCDTVMDKMNYDKGLVRYTTENALEGKKTNILRPRIIIYTLLLVVLLSGVVYSIETRSLVTLDVIRDRNALYRENIEGQISNSYTIKVLNMDVVGHSFEFSAEGLEGIKVSIKSPIDVAAGQIFELPLVVTIDPGFIKEQTTELIFSLHALDDLNLKTKSDSRFIGPMDF
ncbi:MAG: cytochrome c oxidase accessory protein CcoG [Piscirickettsiaceae bacterium]|nr:MAG: cytochrome c oxidase accessory protein CcoG [Piscirickettsiaceae bacterium]